MEISCTWHKRRLYVRGNFPRGNRFNFSSCTTFRGYACSWYKRDKPIKIKIQQMLCSFFLVHILHYWHILDYVSWYSLDLKDKVGIWKTHKFDFRSYKFSLTHMLPRTCKEMAAPDASMVWNWEISTKVKISTWQAKNGIQDQDGVIDYPV